MKEAAHWIYVTMQALVLLAVFFAQVLPVNILDDGQWFLYNSIPGRLGYSGIRRPFLVEELISGNS